MIFYSVKKNFLSFVIATSCAFASQNCSKDKTKNPQINPPPQPTPDKNEQDSKKKEVTLIEIGKVAVAEGDVLKDQGQQYRLSKLYSFKLTKTENLQIRKEESNGNCGNAKATFVITRPSEVSLCLLCIDRPYGVVTIDPKKIYEGFPTEKFQRPLEAGKYQLNVDVVLDQECKDQQFYYDFVLEEASKP